MSEAELIYRLTDLVKLQADIIREQSEALAQVQAVVELEDMIEKADRERLEIVGKI